MPSSVNDGGWREGTADGATHHMYMITPVWTVSSALQIHSVRSSQLDPNGVAYMINQTFPVLVSSRSGERMEDVRSTHIDFERP